MRKRDGRERQIIYIPYDLELIDIDNGSKIFRVSCASRDDLLQQMCHGRGRVSRITGHSGSIGTRIDILDPELLHREMIFSRELCPSPAPK